MYKRIFGTLFFVSVVLTLHAQSVSQKIVLNKGQVFETVTNNLMTISQEMMGRKIDVKINNKTTLITEVKDVKPDGFYLANTIKRMVSNNTAMGQDMNFDSDKPEDMYSEMGQRVKGMINHERTVTVNKMGRVMESSAPDSSTNDALNKLMGGGWSEFVKGGPYPLLAVLPAKAVKPGDSWTDSISSSSETIKMTYINTYTLKSVSDNEITIDIAGRITQEGTIEQQGMSVGMNMTGTSKGEAVYDQKTGVLKRDSLNSDMTGTSEVMGQTLPLAMNMKIENEVKKRL